MARFLAPIAYRCAECHHRSDLPRDSADCPISCKMQASHAADGLAAGNLAATPSFAACTDELRCASQGARTGKRVDGVASASGNDAPLDARRSSGRVADGRRTVW
jgi:hypothetical protein